MAVPRNLDPTDLIILHAIIEKAEIRTREVEQKAYLSRMQVLRRLQRLKKQGLIVRKNGKTKAYHYMLNLDVDIAGRNHSEVTVFPGAIRGFIHRHENY